jgi:hypothetical protein
MALAIAVPAAIVVGLPETVAGGIEPSRMEKLLPLMAGADSVLFGPGMSGPGD